MACEFKQRRCVEFADIDQAGVVHFTHFFRYMEAVEALFFRHLTLPFISETGGTHYGWPRLAAHCDYRAPLCFQDTVDIHLFVTAITRSTLTFYFHFRKKDAGSLVAIGELKTVYARWQTKPYSLEAVAIPEEISSQLSVAPTERWKRV